MKPVFLFLAWCIVAPAAAEVQPVELHQVIDLGPPGDQKILALTLDACEGQADVTLTEFLIEQGIPATIFVTKKWLRRNPEASALLLKHGDLFEVENHGAAHVPAIIGADRQVHGLHGNRDIAHLKREVQGGAAAIEAAFGQPPHWYRGATAEYDPEAIQVIESLGYKIAGFSVNADQGATLSRAGIVKRLSAVKSGDIIIAHMNRPQSHTGEGLAAGLPRLVARGFHFVRLDQVKVRTVP